MVSALIRLGKNWGVGGLELGLQYSGLERDRVGVRIRAVKSWGYGLN